MRWGAILLAFALCAAPGASVESDPGAAVTTGELLTYRITWLGLHCGDMALESRGDTSKPALVQLEMRVRTTPWFDGIYRVRSVVTSLYDQRRASTRRYHERSRERDETKDDLWVVQPERERARRVKNDRVQTYDVPPQGALDPLALLYRIRVLFGAPGESRELTVMTSRGAVQAHVASVGWEQIERSGGPVPALRVVQQPVGDDEFGRGGSMTMWLGAGTDRVPYRIEFDLPFGDLVATLYEPDVAPRVEADPTAPEG